jgi:hypothetical protein
MPGGSSCDNVPQLCVKLAKSLECIVWSGANFKVGEAYSDILPFDHWKTSLYRIIV